MLIRTISGLAFAALALLMPGAAFAYSVETLPDVGVSRDFVVGPGKFEAVMEPGETRTVEMKVTNRMGDERSFQASVEDFTGSKSLTQTVQLLGGERGPYSLRDYLTPERKTFTLKHGERATLRITVSVPADAEPGGRYGSVLISTVSKADERARGGGAAIVARIGSLFFITVPGEVNKAGSVTDFQVQGGDKLLSSGPVRFDILYENTGSVHLTPYGEIAISNIFGQQVAFFEIEPWFAMPDSIRLRQVEWKRELLFGKYTAVASINRGYNNIVDEKSYSFWVIPWKLLIGAFAIILILVIVLLWILSKFEIRRKTDDIR